ncbi:MAG: NAD(+) diphosphatase [Pseudomonadota bacterium]
MSNAFFDREDQSALNGFSGNRLNRLGEQRETLDVPVLIDHPGAAFYLLSEARQLVKSVDPYKPTFSADEVVSLGGNPADAFLLGLDDAGAPSFATSVPRKDDYPFEAQAVDLRALTRAGTLNGAEIGATAQARSLVLWHQSHRFCARCGTATDVTQAGYSRTCPNCGAHHFPRTDPVVIMLAVDEDYCLLGRSPHFPDGMVSCLAGFVEVGETLEEAVRRETFEESGIRTGRIHYHSSQPWPFSSSLMIGCLAEALSKDIVTDDELEMCRWFSRKETSSILERTHPEGIWSPPRMAIAHQLMRAFAEA